MYNDEGWPKRPMRDMNDFPVPTGRISVFEKRRDSKVWWIRWNDQEGRSHEMKVGAKARALVIRKAAGLIERSKALPDWSWPQRD
jgi:hypothetical protein